MYRRIEMIYQQETNRNADGELQVSPALKAGLMACGNEQVVVRSAPPSPGRACPAIPKTADNPPQFKGGCVSS